jgi:hypothetical protein
MTSGFRRNDGTDYDNLFYVANENLGALGFVGTGGVDLGNKYSTQNTLGYAVGLKNNAGTDLGYLRGNKQPYDITVRWDTSYEYWKFYTDSDSYDYFKTYDCSIISNRGGISLNTPFYIVDKGCIACLATLKDVGAPYSINGCVRTRYAKGYRSILYLYKSLTTRDTGYYITM